MLSPNDYPDGHAGWAALIDDLALDDLTSHDRGHIPLRWRLLVHYRRTGARWDDVARLYGISPQAACKAYARWAHLCCTEETP